MRQIALPPQISNLVAVRQDQRILVGDPRLSSQQPGLQLGDARRVLVRQLVVPWCTGGYSRCNSAGSTIQPPVTGSRAADRRPDWTIRNSVVLPLPTDRAASASV